MNYIPVSACGDPVVGLWCSNCLLSSGFAQVLLVGGTPQVLCRCTECHEEVEVVK